MSRNSSEQNPKQVTAAVTLTIFARCSVNHLLFKCGWSTAVHRSVDMAHKHNVAVPIMKSCMKASRWITAEGRGFSGLCPRRILKMPVNGDTIIPTKTCVIVNAMLKTFVGLLRHFRGSLLTT